MLRLRLMALLSCLAAIAAPARADLSQEIEAVLRDPYLKKVSVGIRIVRLGSDTSSVMYENNGGEPLTPASNLKVITTAAALEKFGADFRYRTTLLQKGNTLALVGDGDPTLGDAEMLRAHGWTSTTLFEKWAAALVERGLKSADQLIVDDSIFDTTFVHPTWPTDQLHKRYVAGVGGLNFNANCLDFYLRTRGPGETVEFSTDPQTTYAAVQNSCVQGSKNAVWLSRLPNARDIILRGETPRSNDEPISVTIDDPGLFAGAALRDAFGRSGVAIAGGPKRERIDPSDGWTVLAAHETPLSQVLTRANKDSMNVYAEALCKRLGSAATGKAGTWANGNAATGKFLTSIGVASSEFSLDDGCGLSRKNKISANAMTAVLEHEFRSPHRDLYLSTLSVAGVDGTLKDRFGPGLRDRVHAKSGFIDGVSTLSGYLQAKDGQWYAFSVMFNGIAKGTNAAAKKLQEKIVSAIEP